MRILENFLLQIRTVFENGVFGISLLDLGIIFVGHFMGVCFLIGNL